MKLGIYCRISRNKEGNDLSIPDQKQKGIKKAKELSLPYEIYVDEGKSGTLDKIEDRPEFERFISDITKGNLSAVFAYDQSRFERNPQVRFIINSIFKKYNILYYTELDGLVDLDNPQNELIGDIMSVINKYMVTLTKIKVKSALKTRVESGKAHSILPYGYTKNDSGDLIIDEEEAKIIKKIYDLSLSGMGTRSIAEYLNEHEVPTRYNKINTGTISTKNKYTGTITVTEKKDIKWAGNTVRNIIKNTIYKGERKYGGEIYRVPAIVNSLHWDEVQLNLKKNRNNTGKKVEHQYLLKGLIICGVCGRNMYGRTRVSKNDNYYMCSSKRIKDKNCGNRSINIDKIEAFIWDRFFKGDVFLNRIKNEFSDDRTKLDEEKKHIERLKTKLKTLNNEKNRAVELVVKGTLTEADVKDLLSKNKLAIDNTTIKLNESVHRLNIIENNKKILKKYDDEFIHFTTNTTFTQRKKIVNDFIKDIIVKYDEFEKSYDITINFKLGIEKEFYKTFHNFTVILHKDEFVLPRTLNKNPFRKPKITWIDGKDVTMLGGDDSVPYRVFADGFMEEVYNTKVPYGNVDDWSEDEIEYFFNHNPDFYCKESGVSLASKNTELESYKVAKEKFQLVLAKKNEITPSFNTISDVALVGGGNYPQPGEISLSHNGVLFLDELPEFKRTVLEVMRQPLEDRNITISRAKFSVEYPASFMLVASMNPCPCGYYNHPTKDCVCAPGVVQKYLNKISGPLLDRIDIHLEVVPVPFKKLSEMELSENSEQVRERVLKARKIQEERFTEHKGVYANAQMNSKLIRKYVMLDETGIELIKNAMDRLGLSARAYDRILKVARTIADLENEENVQAHHLSEAIHYRSLDRENWGG